jgi:hypothetical protein
VCLSAAGDDQVAAELALDWAHAASGALVVPRPHFIKPEDSRAPRWGTFAYVVSRNGLKTTLDRYWPGGANGPAFHKLSGDATFDFREFGPNAVSDVILYEQPEAYYTPRPLFTVQATSSLLHSGTHLLCQRRSRLAIKRVMVDAFEE